MNRHVNLLTPVPSNPATSTVERAQRKKNTWPENQGSTDWSPVKFRSPHHPGGGLRTHAQNRTRSPGDWWPVTGKW